MTLTQEVFFLFLTETIKKEDLRMAVGRFLIAHKALKVWNFSDIVQVIKPQDWFTLVDHSDTYFHVPVAPGLSSFLWFAFQDRQLKEVHFSSFGHVCIYLFY